MNTIPDCFSCWHKKLFGIVWMPIWCATFHSRDRIRIESWILEKVLKWICPAFSRPGKSLVNRDQVWKNGRVLSFFKAPTSQLYIFFFFFILVIFNFICTFAEKKALLLRCLRSLLVPYLIALSLEKEKFWKSLEFWIQKSVWAL